MTLNLNEIHRIFDANLNRAREALRVLEETFRFARSQRDLTAEVKALRHQLVEMESLAGLTREDLLRARDAAQDVGRPDEIPPAPYDRGRDLGAANFARFSEAMRALAEYSRLLNRADAASVAESLRFKAYTLEKDAFAAASKSRLDGAGLYFILSGELLPPDPVGLAETVVRGGADVVQLRGFALPDRDHLDLADKVCRTVRDLGAVFIVNDRVDLALASGAHGIHLGSTDLPLKRARNLVPGDFIVGASVRSLEEGQHALDQGADYVGLGTVFPSPLKPERATIGVDEAVRASRSLPLPVFPIGGIGFPEVLTLAEQGIRRACVSTALMKADDPEAFARTLSENLSHASTAK